VRSRSTPTLARARMTSALVRNRDFATLAQYARGMLGR
jgi:hypothetical protein